MGEPYLHGIKHVEQIVQQEAQLNRQRKEEAERQRLVTKGDVLRVINSDEVMKMMRFYVEQEYNACDARLKDPKVTDINEIMLLKGELQAHQKYVELFQTWSQEGKQALKKLLQKETNGSTE